jgi:hypothetical protein
MLLGLLLCLARKGIGILICHRHCRERRRLAGTVEVRAGDPAALARPTISSATELAGGTAGAADAARTTAEMKVATFVVDVLGRLARLTKTRGGWRALKLTILLPLLLSVSLSLSFFLLLLPLLLFIL